MSRLLIGRSARRARVERPMTIPFARLEPRQQDPNPSPGRYGTGQSRAPRRRPRAGPRRRVYPYVYCGSPPLPLFYALAPGPARLGSQRLATCDWSVTPVRKLTRNSTGTSAFQCAPGFEYCFDVDRPIVTGSPPAQESLSRLARGQGHRRGETPTPVSAPLLVAFSLVSRRKCPVLYAFSIEAPPGSSGPGARWRQRGSGGGGAHPTVHVAPRGGG